jgi:hypothetical protein
LRSNRLKLPPDQWRADCGGSLCGALDHSNVDPELYARHERATARGGKMSQLKIYGIPMSRAFRALWMAMASELGVDYENVPIHFADGSSKTPEYLAINPNGKIPAIEDDGLKLWESMADQSLSGQEVR